MHAETFMPGQDNVEWFREREKRIGHNRYLISISMKKWKHYSLCQNPNYIKKLVPKILETKSKFLTNICLNNNVIYQLHLLAQKFFCPHNGTTGFTLGFQSG